MKRRTIHWAFGFRENGNNLSTTLSTATSTEESKQRLHPRRLRLIFRQWARVLAVIVAFTTILTLAATTTV